jgi:hypothetical protein
MTHSFGAQLPRLSYNNQDVIADRLGLPWGAQRVNRSTALSGSIFDRRLKLEFNGSRIHPMLD